MSLDLAKLVSQVGDMVARLKAGSRERQERLDRACETLSTHAGNLDALRDKIARSKTTWLVAGIVEGLHGRHRPPSLPADFSVIATDGSHIDVDRHRATRCFLINIGTVMLRYGSNPSAALDSQPHLYADDEDLVIAAAGMRGREQPIEGALLGIKRAVDECRWLAELAADAAPDVPTLALLDGSLILWGLEAYAEFITEELLDKGLLPGLEKLRKMAGERELALASYISLPRGTDVVNALKIALCPKETVDSDRCPDCETRECDAVVGVRDREVFARLLAPGERSDVFLSSSKVLKRYGAHQVCFFYLNVDDEVARVEVSHWVAASDSRLSLAHGLVLDQCRRGHGYPVALSEAHERAVVTGADAQSFWQLVEASMTEEKLPLSGSAKSRSKRTRWV